MKKYRDLVFDETEYLDYLPIRIRKPNDTESEILEVVETFEMM